MALFLPVSTMSKVDKVPALELAWEKDKQGNIFSNCEQC
jgi:hypothetical protein